MSVCSASDPRWRRAFGALAATASLALATAAWADTTGTIQRVQVGPGGVLIEEVDSTAHADGNVHVDVEVGGIRIDTENEAGLVRVFADAEVPAGRRIEGDAVAVFGSLRVAGEVTGQAIAVFGTVELEPGANVHGDVVAVGGALDHAPGAQVGGQSVSIAFMPSALGAPTTVVMLATVLVLALLALLFARVLTWLFPERLERIGATAGRQPFASFGIGLLSVPLLVLGLFLLVVTFIGAPIAVLLCLGYLLASHAGHLVVTGMLGARMLRNGRPAGMAAMAAGIAFLTVFFVVGALLWTQQGFGRTLALFFLLLGVLLTQVFSTLGIGAVLLSRFGSREAPGGTAAPVRLEGDPTGSGAPA